MTSSENIEEAVLIFEVPKPFYPSHHDSLNNSSSSHFLFTDRGLSQDVTFMKQICHLEQKKTLLTESRGHELGLTNPNFMHYYQGKNCFLQIYQTFSIKFDFFPNWKQLIIGIGGCFCRHLGSWVFLVPT